MQASKGTDPNLETRFLEGLLLILVTLRGLQEYIVLMIVESMMQRLKVQLNLLPQ